MTPGMTIRVTNTTGTLQITAADELTRAYTWEGATRSVEMIPRETRWQGSLGLYYPGPGDHWKEHHGITRGVLEEGQQHFKTLKEAQAWLRSRSALPSVYTDSGLVVGWDKTLPRRQLNVEVWQLFIGGKKPQHLPGSQNARIVVTHVPVSRALTMAAAVRANKADAVRALLAKGANPNTPNADGSTVLLRAVEKENVAIVQLLLQKGAKVNAVATDGEMKGSSPLVIAALGNSVGLVEVLLQAGADVKATDGQLQNTALSWACTTGNIAMAKLLLAKGSEVDARNATGGTPLMGAAMIGNVEVVKLLIAKGAKVTARDDATRQLYGRAQFSGDTATVEKIRQSGKLNTLHEDGRSVLDWARIGGNAEVIVLLQRAGAKE